MGAKAPTPSKAEDTTLRDLKATESATWTLPGYGDVEQKPLSFFAKTEFFAVLSNHIEAQLHAGVDIEPLIAAVSSEEVRNSLVSGAGGGGDQAFKAAVQVFAQFISSAPKLLEELYLIWLGIDHASRPTALIGLRQIDDETGFGIIDTFVTQNGAAIADFLPRLQQLFGKITTAAKTKS